MKKYPSMTVNQAVYYFTCKYMALTELYDRILTDLRSPDDPTEAYIITPFEKSYSKRYALMMREELPIHPSTLREEIQRHKDYTAQKWIDEYNRLEFECPCKYCEELDERECENCPKWAGNEGETTTEKDG